MRRILVHFAVFPAVCCLSILPAQTAPDPDGATLLAFDSLLRDIDRSQKQTTSQPTARAEAREYFRNRYDMDPATLDEVTKAAASYVPSVVALDAEAAAIIRAAREKYRAAVASGGGAVPPPPQLAKLQTRKDALLRQTLSSLEIAIGPAQLRYIIYYLRFFIYFRPTGAEAVVR